MNLRKRIFAGFTGVARLLVRIGNIIGITGILVMIVIIMTNIFSRFFGESFAGTYELVQLTSVLVISFAILYTQIKKMHIVVNIVLVRLPQRIKAICYRFACFISAGICAVLAGTCYIYAWRNWLIGEHTATLKIFLPPFRIVWGIGCLLLCVAFLVHMFERQKE
jgi:TRAP-type C4-dicarboxylate transport system permease small subunit